ncbi:DUF4097 family beta strand repeat-containing protein [Rhizohabitans arisaemae]|uniref:DUF4097 family beta strand repeat-containing protein n=1 Tax=Rhizohabitans arisaemae TaxID=2720610 RepID=UPI0024B16EE0|nr:DUF4097 family beta strand repeat-containing protein [Rhizohabitans arisaemae]
MGMAQRVCGPAVVLASALAVAGCGIIGTESRETKTYQVADAVHTLDVQSGAGDVTVVESDRSGVAVTETLYWGGDRPTTERPVSGGTLTLAYSCGGGLFGIKNCGVDYRVEIPRGMRLVKVGTGAGDVRLEGVGATLDIGAGAGDITAVRLVAGRTKAESGAGDVDLAFTDAPDQVEVETGAGDGTLRLPPGPYAVTLHTGAGSETVHIDRDPNAPRKISVQTGAGNVNLLKV